jgi:N-acetylornithine carbamoyltransferase
MAVSNSFALASAQFGHDVRIAHPKGYELDSELLTEIEKQAKENGGSLEIVNDIDKAFENVTVVYAKSWGSFRHYGNASQDIKEREIYRGKWIVDKVKMQKTNNAVFMHCLPVRRNVVVADEVIDSDNSAIFEQAENRLHVQKAILARLVK